MKTSILLGLSALNSLINAAPIDIEKRDIVYFTHTQVVVQTIDIVTTVWVPAGGVAAPKPTPAPAPAPAPVSSLAAAPPAPVVTSTSVSTAAPPPPPPPPPPPAPSPEPVSTTTGVFLQATSVPAPKPAPPPAPSSAPAAAPSPVQASPNPGTGSILSPPYPAPSGSGATLAGASTSTGCTSGAVCYADITHYNPMGGYGACGTILEQTGMTVAIPWQMMGSASNSNELCGKTVHLTDPHTGKSTTATVEDKCGGCNNPTDVDLTSALFEFFYPGTVTGDGSSSPTDPGRVHGIEWYFE
ncbi:hypothetical protein MMC25_007013 [Agyrium rufum]|nr:hypothetical protein [Agyrium rufum]